MDILKRLIIIAVASIAIIFTAQSCSLPFFNNDSGPSTVLGVLKRDPSVRSEGFGTINAVETLSGNIEAEGLADLSAIKLEQQNSQNYFTLTEEKGLFVTKNSGRTWRRLYIFPLSDDSEQRQQDIARNDSFTYLDFTIDPDDDEVIYIAGEENSIGKIYRSSNGGDTFKQVYSEVDAKVGVNRIAVDPTENVRVYATLEGGALIKSEDAGTTWRKVQAFSKTPVQLGFVEEFDNLFYALLERDGIATTSDFGETWQTDELIKVEAKDGSVVPLDIDIDNIDTDLYRLRDFKNYDKAIPVPNFDTEEQGWLLIADGQLWYTEDYSEPFLQMALPLQGDNFETLTATPDPVEGLEKIWVSIDDRLFVTNDRGVNWNLSDNIQLQSRIGHISQVLIDRTNTDILYISLTDPSNNRRNGGLFGF